MNSEQLFQKAEKHLIAGTSAAGRFHGIIGRPLYLESADGSHLYDVDGKEYIDYNNSAGAAFFGYNHPRLKQAVERSLEMGFFMNFESEHHQELAKILCEVVPSAEIVRLSNTGTEVTMGAIRLARTFTGKEKVIKLEGHFHGMHECIFYNHGALGKMDKYGEIEPLPDSDGFPKNFAEPLVVLEANNIDAFEHASIKYKGQIAAVILEPISFNCGCMPSKKDYLETLRAICDREEIVLIFDEVLSGFRMGIGGAQEFYGVTPDLTTLAKALGGGFPISALVGKAKVMKHLNPGGSTVMSGTYTGSLMPVLAAIECLKIMKTPGFYTNLNSLAEKLYNGINSCFGDFNIPGHVRGFGARFATYFGLENEEDDYDFRKIAEKFDAATYREFVKQALDHGLYFHIEGWSSEGLSLPTHSGITAAHTEEDIDLTLEKIRAIFQNLSK